MSEYKPLTAEEITYWLEQAEEISPANKDDLIVWGGVASTLIPRALRQIQSLKNLIGVQLCQIEEQQEQIDSLQRAIKFASDLNLSPKRIPLGKP